MTLLFDLDGTLLDTAPDFAYAMNTVRHRLNLPNITLEKIRPAVSHGLQGLMKVGFDLFPEHADYKSIAQQCLDLYIEHLGEKTKWFTGIPELLEQLEQRHIPWGIVTNKPEFLTNRLLKNLNLFHRAACVVSGDTTANSKPHPEPLLYACEKINISPQNCIYIGDAERDIQAGKAAGMWTIGALFGYIDNIDHALSWNADHYVHHASDIWPHLEKKWQ